MAASSCPYPMSGFTRWGNWAFQPAPPPQHPLGRGDTLNRHTRWKPGIPAPSLELGGLPNSAPLPPTWRMECDTRRDPAARREGLRSSSVAALKGEMRQRPELPIGRDGGQIKATTVGWWKERTGDSQLRSLSSAAQSQLLVSASPSCLPLLLQAFSLWG